MSRNKPNIGNALRGGHRGGFTLVEILIVVVILGILASIVIPQFSNATQEANESVLKEDLRFLRNQILAYYIEHNSVPPGHPGGDVNTAADATTFVAQMTNKTDENGNVGTGTGYRYGPYLKMMPKNPLNLEDSITIVSGWPGSPSDAAGWIYQPSTLRIAADSSGTGADGNDYFEY